MILEFKNVTGKTKHFNLQDISFALEPGFIMGLAGKNGAGKTTLIDYIMNPQPRYTGTIRIDGVDIRENHVMVRNQIGFFIRRRKSNNHGFFISADEVVCKSLERIAFESFNTNTCILASNTIF